MGATECCLCDLISSSITLAAAMSSPCRRQALGSWREVGPATRDLLDSAISGTDGTPGKWKRERPSSMPIWLITGRDAKINLSPTNWVSSMASHLGCINPCWGLCQSNPCMCMLRSIVDRQRCTHVGLRAIHAIAGITSQYCIAVGPPGTHHAQDAIEKISHQADDLLEAHRTSYPACSCQPHDCLHPAPSPLSGPIQNASLSSPLPS